MVTAAQCKASGTVLYNGSCQRRGNSCNGGKGYLGQVAANNGWGVCINFGTRAPKTTPSKQTNNCTPSNCFGKAETKFPGCNNTIICWQSPRPNGPMSCFAGNGTDEHGCPPDLRVNCDTCARARAKWLSENKGGAPQVPGRSQGGGGGTAPSGKCGGCNFGDMGCEVGKHFCEFQGWLAGSVGGLGWPVMIGGVAIIGILLLKR